MKYITRMVNGQLYEGTIELDEDNKMTRLKDSDLKFVFDINEFDPNKLLTIVGKEFASPIKKWLFLSFDGNIMEEEGGFDNWWGMNSFPMHELGLKFIFEYECNNVTLTIKAGG